MSRTIDEEREKKKRYLESFLQAKIAVNNIQEEIQELFENETNPSSPCGEFIGGGESRDLSNYITEKESLINDLILARLERIRLYTDIFKRIESMEDEEDKNILRLRYILSKPNSSRNQKMKDIYKILDYSAPQCQRKLNKALDNFSMD